MESGESGPKVVEEKSIWDKRREWAAFILSTVAFVVSLITVFVTLKEVDDLRAFAISEPIVRFDKGTQRIVIEGELSFLFMNAGTRPIGLADASIEIGMPYDDGGGSERCKGISFETNLGGLVVDEKKIVERKVVLTKPYLPEPFDVRKEGETWSYIDPESVKRGYVYVCVFFQAASPSDAGLYKGMKLSRSHGVRPDEGGAGMTINFEPFVIVHQVRLRF